MADIWNDKVVLITGSSQGIGKEVARQFAGKGARIMLNARNEIRLNKALEKFKAEGFSVAACAGDVSDFADCTKIVESAISQFGKIDVLINNAGLATMSSIAETSPEVFRKIIDVNLNGSVFMTRAALPYLIKTKGSVVFIGSVAGIHGIPDYSAYSSSKMALNAVAESLRIELSNTGVHVGLIQVGFTENDPKKTFLNNKGEEVPLPSRNTIKQQAVNKVAAKIIKSIEKRRFKTTFTVLGKINAIVNRVFPYLVHLILLRSYKKS